MPREYRLPSLYDDDKDDFFIIAHRGASFYYPENTMAAFRGAVEMDAEMIELDVMLSRDGIPVVFHDEKLRAHTNGRGFVRYHTLKELQQLDAGSWYDKRFADQRIPKLEEVLDFASGTIALNIEIKKESVTDGRKGGVAEKCLELVRKYGMEEYVLFSSFDYRAIRHLREMDSEIPVALLYNRRQSKRKLPHELVEEYEADAFNCSYWQYSRKRITSLREHGIPSFVYTVDTESRMRKLIAAGVNGIFTNRPDLLRQVIEDYHNTRQ